MTIIKTILENPYSILQLPPTLWLPVYFSQAFQFLGPFNTEILAFFDKMIQITFSTNSTKASQSRLKIIFLRLPSKKQQPFKKVNFFFFLLAFFETLQNISLLIFIFFRNIKRQCSSENLQWHWQLFLKLQAIKLGILLYWFFLAVPNWGCANVCFLINENATSSFWYFHFSCTNLTFVKHFQEKITFSRRIFKVLLKFHCFAKLCDLATLDRKMTALQIFFGISTKGRFLCLIVFVNWRNIIYLNFLIFITCFFTPKQLKIKAT